MNEYSLAKVQLSLPLHIKNRVGNNMERQETGQCPCCGSDDVQQCDDGTFICMQCGETLCK